MKKTFIIIGLIIGFSLYAGTNKYETTENIYVSEIRVRSETNYQVLLQVKDSSGNIVNLASKNGDDGLWGFLKDDGKGSLKYMLSLLQLAYSLDLPITINVNQDSSITHACITEIRLKK